MRALTARRDDTAAESLRGSTSGAGPKPAAAAKSMMTGMMTENEFRSNLPLLPPRMG